MNDTKQSGMTGTQGSMAASAKRLNKEEPEKSEREGRDKRSGLNNVKSLLAEAYEDADARSPVFLLVTHAVNIHDLVQDCHHQKCGHGGSVKLWHFQMGKGVQEDVEEKMAKAAQNGDWIILENLHLVLEWLPTFEERIAKWKGAELNPRFRMWITSVPVPDFPASILERSIKVALQPPGCIKAKIEEMLGEQEKDAFVRKSGKHANVHKNLFFGLAYLHAILEGRKKYGSLGWHVPYKFDRSDFDVSQAQLTQVMKNSSGDYAATLEMLKYYYAHINYAGKIQRVED